MPAVFKGAEGRFEDYVLLDMMETEWNRATHPEAHLLKNTSDKALIVLLFWTYFETRIERLLRIGLDAVPGAIMEDILDRYSSIGSRLDKCYRILFSSTYEKDLQTTGCPAIWPHLKEVQKRRNEFIHGDPNAIDSAFVQRVVGLMKDEHEAWIAVFNLRLRAHRAQHV